MKTSSLFVSLAAYSWSGKRILSPGMLADFGAGSVMNMGSDYCK